MIEVSLGIHRHVIPSLGSFLRLLQQKTTKRRASERRDWISTTSKVVVVVVNEISNRILIAFGEMGVERQIERETHAQTLTQTHTI